MVVNIGIPTKDCVYIGTSSYDFTLKNASYVDENMPVYAINRLNGVLVSTTLSMIENNIVRYGKHIFNQRDFKDSDKVEYMAARNVFKNIVHKYQELKYNNFHKEIKLLQGEIFIAKNNSLVKIDPAGIVSICNKPSVLGLYYEEPLAVLDAFKDNDDPIYVILKTFSYLAENTRRYGQFPIIIKNTKNPREVLTFNYAETLNYINEYESKGGNK